MVAKKRSKGANDASNSSAKASLCHEKAVAFLTVLASQLPNNGSYDEVTVRHIFSVTIETLCKNGDLYELISGDTDTYLKIFQQSIDAKRIDDSANDVAATVKSTYSSSSSRAYKLIGKLEQKNLVSLSDLLLMMSQDIDMTPEDISVALIGLHNATAGSMTSSKSFNSIILSRYCMSRWNNRSPHSVGCLLAYSIINTANDTSCSYNIHNTISIIFAQHHTIFATFIAFLSYWSSKLKLKSNSSADVITDALIDGLQFLMGNDDIDDDLGYTVLSLLLGYTWLSNNSSNSSSNAIQLIHAYIAKRCRGVTSIWQSMLLPLLSSCGDSNVLLAEIVQDVERNLKDQQISSLSAFFSCNRFINTVAFSLLEQTIDNQTVQQQNDDKDTVDVYDDVEEDLNEMMQVEDSMLSIVTN